MHAVVVARSPLAPFLAALGRRTEPFRELRAGQDSVNPRTDGEPVLVGEADGLAYLFDVYQTAFAHNWGLLARVAWDLDTLVLGCIHERGEEHTTFFAARGAQVLRAFWSNRNRTTRPYERGEPLPCEAACPLSAPGGAGLAAALRAFGFARWDDPSPDLLPGERWVTWPGDVWRLVEDDDLGDEVKDHIRAFWNPAYREPEVVVRVRRIDE